MFGEIDRKKKSLDSKRPLSPYIVKNFYWNGPIIRMRLKAIH